MLPRMSPAITDSPLFVMMMLVIEVRLTTMYAFKLSRKGKFAIPTSPVVVLKAFVSISYHKVHVVRV